MTGIDLEERSYIIIDDDGIYRLKRDPPEDSVQSLYRNGRKWNPPKLTIAELIPKLDAIPRFGPDNDCSGVEGICFWKKEPSK